MHEIKLFSNFLHKSINYVGFKNDLRFNLDPIFVTDKNLVGLFLLLNFFNYQFISTKEI